MKADRERVERDLTALIAVPSITGDEFAVQDLVAELLMDAGLEVRSPASKWNAPSCRSWPAG